MKAASRSNLESIEAKTLLKVRSAKKQAQAPGLSRESGNAPEETKYDRRSPFVLCYFILCRVWAFAAVAAVGYLCCLICSLSSCVCCIRALSRPFRPIILPHLVSVCRPPYLNTIRYPTPGIPSVHKTAFFHLKVPPPPSPGKRKKIKLNRRRQNQTEVRYEGSKVEWDAVFSAAPCSSPNTGMTITIATINIVASSSSPLALPLAPPSPTSLLRMYQYHLHQHQHRRHQHHRYRFRLRHHPSPPTTTTIVTATTVITANIDTTPFRR